MDYTNTVHNSIIGLQSRIRGYLTQRYMPLMARSTQRYATWKDIIATEALYLTQLHATQSVPFIVLILPS